MKDKLFVGFGAILFALLMMLEPAAASDNSADRSSDISSRRLRAHLEFLASDELEGRGTGQDGLRVAAKYLESQFQLAGLSAPPMWSSMRQPFDFVESEILHSTGIEVTDSDGNMQTSWRLFEEFFIPSKQDTSLHLTGELLFVGYGFKEAESGYDDFADIDANGKFLLVLGGTPPDALDKPKSLSQTVQLARAKSTWAQEKGALGVIYISDLFDMAISRFLGALDSPNLKLPGDDGDALQIVIPPRVADALLRPSGWQVDSLKAAVNSKRDLHFELSDINLGLKLDVKSLRKQTSNVVAFLEGSDPGLRSESVVIGAHYDHLGVSRAGEIYNGADDNGSGTVALLEIARALRQGPPLKRSLLFVAFAGEENGMLGSRHFTARPPIALQETMAMLNIDMVGRGDSRVYVIGSDFISKRLHRINEEAAAESGVTLDYTFNDPQHPERSFFRSDHYQFAKSGIPVIYFTSGGHQDYHQPSDDIDKINFQQLQNIANLVKSDAIRLANSDSKLPRNGRFASKDSDYQN